MVRHLVASSFLAIAAWSQDATTAGRFHVEPPTLLNLGFEWPIQGDANRNATVSVEYRKTGEANWSQGVPLVRIGGENGRRRKQQHKRQTVPCFTRFH